MTYLTSWSRVSIGKIKPFTSTVLATLRDQAADEATVEFGVKLAANSGVIFTSAGVEASLIFKLTWKRKPESPTI